MAVVSKPGTLAFGAACARQTTRLSIESVPGPGRCRPRLRRMDPDDGSRLIDCMAIEQSHPIAGDRELR